MERFWNAAVATNDNWWDRNRAEMAITAISGE
jgi:hypothetical protein